MVTNELANAFATAKDESKSAFEAYKAFSIAETIISTLAAAQKAAQAAAILGPVASAIAAGAVTIAGFARVAAIGNQKFEPRQFGGNVEAGRSFMVGEGGREAFIPNQDGQIISNRDLNKLGGTTHIWNVSTMDAVSFKQFLRRTGNRVLEGEQSKGKLF